LALRCFSEEAVGSFEEGLRGKIPPMSFEAPPHMDFKLMPRLRKKPNEFSSSRRDPLLSAQNASFFSGSPQQPPIRT